YCRLVEKPREALEGKSMAVPYESHRQAEIVSQHHRRFSERQVPQHFEREVTLWNGKKLFLEISNAFLELAGQPELLVSTFRDISARKQAEPREAAFAREVRQLNAELEQRVLQRTAE